MRAGSRRPPGQAIALGALAALVLLPCAARASSGGAVIAFDRTRDGSGRVATVHASGGHVTIVTPAPGNESPIWSPDGRFVAYVSGAGLATADLYVTAIANGRARRVTRAPGLYGLPSWSPDGLSVAWTSDHGGRLGILVATRDAAHQRMLTHGSHDAHPVWSPDGTRIAYVDLADGGLWVVRVDGGDARRLPVTGGVSGSSAPSWSPDGRELAVAAASGAVYAVRADGGGARALTHPHGTLLAWRPVWSPAAATIAFLDLDRHGALDVVSADGRGLRTLALRSDGLSAPSWSPDGRVLAFADAGHHIETIAAGGGGRRVVTRGLTADANPAWRP